MYNRYIRNDDGRYQRIPTQETAVPAPQPVSGPQSLSGSQPVSGPQPSTGPDYAPPVSGPQPAPSSQPVSGPQQTPGDHAPPPGSPPPPKRGFLGGILSKLKLEEIDTGDLLLLLILFLLFKDGEDVELLFALGLMLFL